MLRNVAAIVDEYVSVFELAVACEVFGLDRSEDGLPVFDFAVCSRLRGPLTGSGGMDVVVNHDLDRTRAADLVIVPGWRTRNQAQPPGVVAALRDAVDRGATVLSVCSGAFVLADAGLLDGRRATTHWRYAAKFARRYPNVRVEPDKLYVEDGPVITSAGTSAGIDACLYVVRRELGARVANGIARRMVVPPHRDGGQAQYVETPVPCAADDGDDLAPLLAWMQANLREELSVPALAARAHMSPRTFARRFSAATGTTPHHWLTRQRILFAQRLLEEGELSIEDVAQRVGFGTADLLRHHFSAQVGTTPVGYRRRFSHQPEPA